MAHEYVLSTRAAADTLNRRGIATASGNQLAHDVQYFLRAIVSVYDRRGA
jgi:hypothetical protein